MKALRPYETPRLEELPFLAYGKQLPRAVLSAESMDGGVPARQLVTQFGSPLFVISEERLRQDYRDFLKTFSRPELTTRVAYSVKTNYLPAVCSILKDEGAWAEVVSAMEYELVRALGFAPHEIVFNGPYKEHAALERAMAEGAVVNIDGFDELKRIEQIARGLPNEARIGVRTSFKYRGIGWTKFGFDDDNGDSERALEAIAANPKLKLELLHNHCGTFVLNRELYAESTKRLIALAKRARQKGLAPTAVDVGGGFPSSNHLKPEFDFPGGSSREGGFWQPYAEEICTPILKAKELFGGRPTLILEPGRAVVDSCTHLLSTVVARKEAPDAPPAVIVDAGVNLVPTAVYYDHPLSRASGAPSRHSAGRPVDVFGPLCMQTDQLRRSVMASDVEVGDILSISHVGAYCHSMSMQFIETRPATVLVGPAGAELVRRRETWRDVFTLDHVPERLRADEFDL